MQHAVVAGRHPIQQVMHSALELARGLVGPEHLGAHHGRQGQGYDAGDEHGPRQGQRELLEQGACDAPHQGDGRVHRSQGHRHGDDRHGDLPGTDDGGPERFFPLLDVAVDVLQHHDGVIHHQTDGEHHGEQCHQVYRETEHVHHHHHADEAQRDCDDRDDDRPEGAEEQGDDHQYDGGRFQYGLDDLVDGLVDGDGGVIQDVDLHGARHVALQARQQLQHIVGDVDGVGGRCGIDGKYHGLAAVGAGAIDVVALLQRHLGDVGEADHLAIPGRYHQTLELVGIADLGLGIAVEQGEIAGGLTGGRLIVVAVEHSHHVAGGQVEGGHLGRIQPHPQGKLDPAVEVNLGYPAHGEQLGLDDPLQVVGDLAGVQLGAGEAHVEHRSGGARGGGDRGVFRLFGQLGAHRVDLGQDVGQRGVRIGVQLHVGRHRGAAQLAGGGHEVDVVGLRDRLLQRLGDEALDQIRAGAIVAGVDRDDGVDHLGIFPHLHLEDGLEAQQGYQEAERDRQHRPFYEYVSKSHRRSPRLQHRGLCRNGKGIVFDHVHLGIVAQANLTRQHDLIASLDAGQHMDIIAATLTRLDHHLLGAFHAVSLVNDVDVLAIEGEGDGGLRDHYLVFHRGQYDAGAGEHAGAQLAAVVRDVGLHLDQAALVVDRRLDGGDLTVKLGLGIGIHVDLDGLAEGNLGDVGLGHGEAQAHHAGVFQPHYLGTGFQVLAEEDVAQTHDATEGGADFAAGYGALQALDVRLQ
ncbi:hypothetical protein D3C76_526980 [compost metagenome]